MRFAILVGALIIAEAMCRPSGFEAYIGGGGVCAMCALLVVFCFADVVDFLTYNSIANKPETPA